MLVEDPQKSGQSAMGQLHGETGTKEKSEHFSSGKIPLD